MSLFLVAHSPMFLPIVSGKLTIMDFAFLQETYGKLKVGSYIFALSKKALREAEFIVQEIVQNVGKALEGITDPKHAPDPSFTLQLSDETLSGSNLFAIQKFFDGEFQFDVFFESRSAHTTLTCTHKPYSRRVRT